MIATVCSLKRGVRNVIRNPIRLVLVVVLLGASLTFTAAMLGLNAGSQNQIAQIRQEVGTTISIAPANSGFGQTFGTIGPKQVTKTSDTTNVVRVVQTVQGRYAGSNLYGTAKLPKQFQQFGFQRFGSGGSGTGSGGSSGFPGGTGGNRSGGGPSFRRQLINGGKGKTIEPTVTGVTGAANGITLSGGSLKMLRGRDLATGDAKAHVAIMSTALAKANKLSIGSTFKFNGTVTKLVGEYTVIGATASPFLGTSAANDTLVVPVKLGEKALKLSGVTSLTAYAYTASDVNSVVNSLTKSLGNSVTVTSDSSQYASTLTSLNSTGRNIQAALIASIITAALVIVFAVFIIVRERTREIGVLKAIGASGTNIVAQFTTEVLGMSLAASAVAAVLLAAFGGTIASKFNVSTAQPSALPGTGPGGGFRTGGFPGGGGGFTGTPQFTRFARNLPPLHTDPLTAGLTGSSLLILLGLAIGLAVVASWVPTWYVSRLRPARVLSNA
jgi:putative ABC transport system permease protein